MPARRSASAAPNPLDPSSATDHGPRGHRAGGRRLAPRPRVSRRPRPRLGGHRGGDGDHPAGVAGAVRRRRPAPLAGAALPAEPDRTRLPPVRGGQPGPHRAPGRADDPQRARGVGQLHAGPGRAAGPLARGRHPAPPLRPRADPPRRRGAAGPRQGPLGRRAAPRWPRWSPSWSCPSISRARSWSSSSSPMARSCSATSARTRTSATGRSPRCSRSIRSSGRR